MSNLLKSTQETFDIEKGGFFIEKVPNLYHFITIQRIFLLKPFIQWSYHLLVGQDDRESLSMIQEIDIFLDPVFCFCFQEK